MQGEAVMSFTDITMIVYHGSDVNTCHEGLFEMMSRCVDC
jgi:hypothetical protein